MSFVPIVFQVFSKHLPGQEESKGILGDEIISLEILEKSKQTDGRTDRHTDTLTQTHRHNEIRKLSCQIYSQI